MNSNGLMLFLRLVDIEWVQAAGQGVELHVGKKTHLLRATFAAVAAKLPPDRFLRLSPATLVNIAHIQELQPALDGEYEVLLHNGTRLTLTRGCGGNLRQVGLLVPASLQPITCSQFTPERPAGNAVPSASRRWRH